jgi:hypothetical protein
MAIWELGPSTLTQVPETSFQATGIKERGDLQRVLRAHLGVIAPDTLVIAEEYGEWADARRRIDLLGVDRDARLVVIELKRDVDGGHMELQALRYAAMVSSMTFRRAVEVYAAHLARLGEASDGAEARLLEFFEWTEPDESAFANDVRIVLASADFSKEITTTVLWLRERDVDIRCVRLKPYRLENRILLDVQPLIPLPEAADYQVQLKQKAEEVRTARESSRDFGRFDLMVGDVKHEMLSKRWLMLELVRGAIDAGITPEQLAAHLPNGASRFLSVDGVVDTAGFRERLRVLRKPSGKPYEERRYFLGDGELLHVGGRTYAFSNQWGDERWAAAVQDVIDAYPQLAASYRRVEED